MQWEQLGWWFRTWKYWRPASAFNHNITPHTNGTYNTLTSSNMEQIHILHIIRLFHHRHTLINQAIALNTELKDSIASDKRTRLEGICDEIGEDLIDNKVQQAFQQIRSLQSYKPRPPSSLKNPDGSNVTTHLQERQVWFEHWQSTLEATPTTLERLIEQNAQTSQTNQFQCSDPRAIPSLPSTVARFAHAKNNKAAGEDSIPGDLFKAAPMEMAKIFHPLEVKSTITGQQPLQWKGALQVEIPKKNAHNKSGTATKRGIAVADVSGKQFHNYHRKLLMPAFLEKARPNACGGVPNRGTDFASHIITTTQRLLKKQGMSTACLFVDVIAAFDSTDRDITLHTPHQTTEDLDAPDRSKQILKDSFNNTWVSVQGVEQILHTTKGSRPGTPLADLHFNILMTQVLNVIEQRLHQHDITITIPFSQQSTLLRQDHQYPQQEQIEVGEVDYVDDVAIPIADISPDNLIHKVALTMSIVYDTFQEHKLKINMDEGKSEVVLTLQGTGATLMQQKIHHQHGSTIPFQTKQGLKHLRVVKQYLHLGTTYSHNMLPTLECVHRSNSATASYNQNLAFLLKEYWLLPKHKHMLVTMLYESRLFYNSQTWGPITDTQIHKLQTPHARTIRTATGQSNNYDTHIPEQYVYAPHTQFLTPRHIIQLRRLQYTSRVIRHAPNTLRALIQAESHHQGSWAQLVKDDLTWIQNKHQDLTKYPNPHHNMTPWEHLFLNPKQWANILKHVKHAIIHPDTHQTITLQIPATIQTTHTHNTTHTHIQYQTLTTHTPHPDPIPGHPHTDSDPKHQTKHKFAPPNTFQTLTITPQQESGTPPKPQLQASNPVQTQTTPEPNLIPSSQIGAPHASRLSIQADSWQHTCRCTITTETQPPGYSPTLQPANSASCTLTPEICSWHTSPTNTATCPISALHNTFLQATY